MRCYSIGIVAPGRAATRQEMPPQDKMLLRKNFYPRTNYSSGRIAAPRQMLFQKEMVPQDELLLSSECSSMDKLLLEEKCHPRTKSYSERIVTPGAKATQKFWPTLGPGVTIRFSFIFLVFQEIIVFMPLHNILLCTNFSWFSRNQRLHAFAKYTAMYHFPRYWV